MLDAVVILCDVAIATTFFYIALLDTGVFFRVCALVGGVVTLMGIPSRLPEWAIADHWASMATVVGHLLGLVIVLAAIPRTSKTLAKLRSAGQLQLDLQYRDAELLAIFNNPGSGFLTVGIDNSIATASLQVAEMLGRSPQDLMKASIQTVISPDDWGTYVGLTQDLLINDRDSGQIEIRYLHSSGREIWILQSGTLIRGKGDRPSYFLQHLLDITELKTANHQLAEQAITDPLTGFRNKRYFDDLSQKQINYAACLHLDLDGFKAVNDGLGHPTGDQVLAIVARRIRRVAHDRLLSGELLRYGGDEFIVLVNWEQRRSLDTHKLADDLLSAIQEPIHLSGDRTVRISASIGIAPIGGTASHLFAAADVAMYRAKHDGRRTSGRSGGICLWTPEIQEEHRQEQLIRQNLPNAADRKELWLAYQPIVSLQTGQVIALEALVRWQCAALDGFVSPGRFVPIAERSGQAYQLFRWVSRMAIAQAAEWQSRGMEWNISINAAPSDLEWPDFVSNLQQIMREFGVDDGRIGIEVTERGLASNLSLFCQVAAQLKDLDYSLKMDDFGAGDRALASLVGNHRIFDTLKVDRSLLPEDPGDRERVIVLQSIQAIASGLGLKTVMEGIEYQWQLDLIRELNFDACQGYFICRPLAASVLETKIGAIALH